MTPAERIAAAPTDDIVKRLRAQGRWVTTKRVPLIPQLDEEEWRPDQLSAEAADEIECLREAQAANLAEIQHMKNALWKACGDDEDAVAAYLDGES